jgi:5-methylcytosine-specific restriction endonuclease McrA
MTGKGITTVGALSCVSIQGGGGPAATRDRPNRPSAAQRGYDKHWRKLRKAHLSEHPLCVACEAEGLVVLATDVDHMKKFRRADGTIDDQLRLDPANLQSLCHSCHSRKTSRTDMTHRAASPLRGSDETGTPVDPDHPWGAS